MGFGFDRNLALHWLVAAAGLCIGGTAWATGVLGFPANGQTVSGVGVVLGYHCTSKNIEIRIDGETLGPAGAGTTLLGTQATCGRTDTGFALLYNFNNLTPGSHTVRAYADGIEFGSATFTSTRSGGLPWLAGESKTITIEDFPSQGRVATAQWTQSLQNFVITGIREGRPGFPLRSAYLDLIVNGWSGAFSVSGDCVGTGSYTQSPANVPVTFEGRSAMRATVTISQTLTNCTPHFSTDTTYAYYDASYQHAGYGDSDGGYGIGLISNPLPWSVRVGDTAMLGVETLYRDSSKAIIDATELFGYRIDPYDDTHVIANLIRLNYNSVGVLQVVTQERFLLPAVGQATPYSIEIQITGGIHLVWTF